VTCLRKGDQKLPPPSTSPPTPDSTTAVNICLEEEAEDGCRINAVCANWNDFY